MLSMRGAIKLVVQLIVINVIADCIGNEIVKVISKKREKKVAS